MIVIGLTGIYSAGFSEANTGYFHKQIIWSVLSISVFTFMQAFSPKYLYYITAFLYIVLILTLLLVLGAGTIHMGARRWLHLGGFQFQPSEIGKIILIFTLAKYYSISKVNWENNKYLISGSIITIIPTFLIFKQPDLGTSLVYPIILIAILFGAGIPIFYLVNILSPLLIVISKGVDFQLFITYLIIYGFVLYKYSKSRIKAVLLWCINLLAGFSSTMVWDKLKPYQKSRILTFLNPERYIQTGGWQVVQSKIAVANGSLWGEGFLKGSQTQLKFLPEGHTDFIFSVVSEEFGHFGVIMIFLFSFIMIYRGCVIAFSCKNKFYYLICVGIVSILIYQFFINIGMTIGIMPVTGLPLPLLSYGGSSLLFNMITLGLLHSIYVHRRDI